MLTLMIAVTPPPMFRNLGGIHLLRDYFVVARIDDGVARLEIRKLRRCGVREGSLPVLIAMRLAYACRTVLMLSRNRSSAMPEGFSLFVLGGLGAGQRESAGDSPS